MSIRVSTAALAAPVADCGGIGVIGGSALPAEDLRADIIKAKKNTDGVVAVNVMYAMKDFYNLVMVSIDAGIDMIITGAGFSRDIFKIGREHNVPIVHDCFLSWYLQNLLNVLVPPQLLLNPVKPVAISVPTKPSGKFSCIRDVVKNVPLIAAGGITNGFEMAEFYG